MKKIFSTKSGSSKNGSVGFKIQRSKANFIATYGNEQQICIYNRHGKLKSDVSLAGNIVEMDWDREGDNLAIICEKSTCVHIWNSLNTKISQLGTNFKENLSCLAWSKVDARLAIGTAKGNLLIFDSATNKKYPILGKHTKTVSSTVWSLTSLLATSGEDKVLTLNSMDGDVIKQIQVLHLPTDLKFANTNLSKNGADEDNVLSFICGLREILIWKFHEDEKPINLPIGDNLGSVITHEWLDDGCIVVGHLSGVVVVISANQLDFGQEMYRMRDHKENLLSLSVSKRLNRLASASSKSIKIHDLANPHELLAIIELEDDDSLFGGPKQAIDELVVSEGRESGVISCAIDWSDDGQLLAAVSPRHILHVFLSQLPMLSAVSLSGLAARLTSLLEITIEPLCPDIKLDGFDQPRSLTVKVEPTFIGIGPNHLAVGMNNRAWFYDHSNPESIVLMEEQDYVHVVNRIKLNTEYSAVATVDGRVTLHWTDPKQFPAKMQSMAACGCMDLTAAANANSLADKLLPFATRQQRNFPETLAGADKISDFELTERYFIYSTEVGNLVHFCLEDWTNMSEYKHTTGIVHISCDKFGHFIAFIDDYKSAYVYNPLSRTVVEFPNFPPTATQIFWNLVEDENPLLIVLDMERISIYRFFANCIPSVSQKSKLDLNKSNPRLIQSESFSQFTVENSTISERLNPNLLQFSNDYPKSSRLQQTSSYGECRLIGVTRLPQHHIPLGIVSENMCFLSQTGRLVSAPLSTHAFKAYTKQRFDEIKSIRINESESEDKTRKSSDNTMTALNLDRKKEKPAKELTKLSEIEIGGIFDQAILVGDFADALTLSDHLRSRSRWQQLGLACVKNLDFEHATQAFRRLENCGQVLAVQRMSEIEEKQLLYGYISMFLGDFDRAQDFFLASSRPVAALDMRRDLLHWDAALQLARNLLPAEVPFISREYAFELECVGDYVNALMNFESALERHSPLIETKMCGSGDSDCEAFLQAIIEGKVVNEQELEQWKEHEELCNAGIARNTIRLGDYKRGVAMALKNVNRALKKECALILEQARQWSEAALLHEAAGQIDSAIAVYLKCKNYDKAGALLRETKASPKMYADYAKAREAMGDYKEAAIAYESVGDWNSVVRLLLEKLNNPTDAVRVVNESQSVEGAKMVAQYFIKIGDFSSAIQFLVLSKCHIMAFELAQKHRKMDVYADVIGLDATPNEYKSVAVHYECEKNFLMAGRFFFYAKQFGKAIRHLLRVPYSDHSPALDLAIEAVGEANDPKLTHMLIIYLMGETDGIAKDARHLFRLYMALHKYREAARTAVIIAREEQMAGNYRNAHDLLFSMVQELRQRKIKVPSEMLDNLGLLHSYTLAKLHIKAGNHTTAAQLLIRVAQNISKFPSHIVLILTSTVIECQKVGLKSKGFTYASILLRPEHRDLIDQKYRRKFESLVRRPEKQSDEELAIISAFSPCPFCSTELQNYELNCASCRTNLPYCALTGKHVIKSDVALCPNCDFPMTYSDLMMFFESHPDMVCPMCSYPLSRDTTRRLVDSLGILLAWNPENSEHQQDIVCSNDPTDASLSTIN